MSVPTVKKRLDLLRRRRDFLAERIRNQNVDPKYDKSEHFALSWVIRFVEEHYVPYPQLNQKPLTPGITGSRDLQESSPVVPTKPSKPSSLISCAHHSREIAREYAKGEPTKAPKVSPAL
jgi:hypothetical protein